MLSCKVILRPFISNQCIIPSYHKVQKRLLNLTRVLNKTELDPVLQDDFDSLKYKPRRHPGVSKQKIVSLPQDLSKSIKVILEDSSYKTLLQGSIELDNYLSARLPPPEQHEIDKKAKDLYNKISKKNIPLDASELECKKITEDTNVKVFNILKKNVYRWGNIAYNRATCLQYLISRSAAEYAVLIRVFDEIDRVIPDYKPRSFFDFGSGLGTGLWAVRQYWKNTIFEYFCVDTSSEMNDIARILLCGGRENAEFPIKGFFQRQFLPSSSELKYSIVLSAYALFEMPSKKERLQTIQKLWLKTEDFLIIIEQGTNAGFKLVNEARDFILRASGKKQIGYVFAPCPNDNKCPRYLEQKTPCNFLIKYFPIPILGKKEPKGELFSYVILRKGSRPEDDKQWPRIVRAPLVRARHTVCRMCTSTGELKEVIFTKRKYDQNTYRCARSSCWGDQLPVKLDLQDNTEEQIDVSEKRDTENE